MSRALGRYELLRPLARGGMAEVYLARRKAAGVEKWLVVKRIRAERARDVRFLDLFVREARLSMSLTHQNIVPVFDFGRIDDQVFLAMERIEGKDLGSALARAGVKRVTPLVAAFIAAECCQALDYAHRRKSPEGTPLGIVHRDITPRNVLLSWSGEVKLTDFGIAALAGDVASSQVGTPAYMAPEQARGEPVDARADVYGLGLVLREVLTGERGRPGSEREAVIAAAKAGTLLPWPEGVPAPLVAIADRATAAAPDDRFPDARAMLAELDTFIVAERAAAKVDAPARQLAAWLDDVWGADRDDSGTSGEIEGNHLVSFLDDGALDVVGTGTQRSMLATAAEAEAKAVPAPAPPPPVIAAPVVAAPPAPRQAPRRMLPFVLAVAVIAVFTLIGVKLMMAPRQEAHDAASDAQLAALKPDAAVIAQTPEAAVAPPPIDAPEAVVAPIDAAIVVVAPRDAGPKVRPAKIDAGAGSAAVAPPTPAVLRRVTINAIPWAYVSVDSDPTSYETMKTFQLAPGRHTFHFKSTVLDTEKDVTIDVPADRDISHVERFGR